MNIQDLGVITELPKPPELNRGILLCEDSGGNNLVLENYKNKDVFCWKVSNRFILVNDDMMNTYFSKKCKATLVVFDLPTEAKPDKVFSVKRIIKKSDVYNKFYQHSYLLNREEIINSLIYSV